MTNRLSLVRAGGIVHSVRRLAVGFTLLAVLLVFPSVTVSGDWDYTYGDDVDLTISDYSEILYVDSSASDDTYLTGIYLGDFEGLTSADVAMFVQHRTSAGQISWTIDLGVSAEAAGCSSLQPEVSGLENGVDRSDVFTDGVGNLYVTRNVWAGGDCELISIAPSGQVSTYSREDALSWDPASYRGNCPCDPGWNTPTGLSRAVSQSGGGVQFLTERNEVVRMGADLTPTDWWLPEVEPKGSWSIARSADDGLWMIGMVDEPNPFLPDPLAFVRLDPDGTFTTARNYNYSGGEVARVTDDSIWLSATKRKHVIEGCESCDERENEYGLWSFDAENGSENGFVRGSKWWRLSDKNWDGQDFNGASPDCDVDSEYGLIEVSSVGMHWAETHFSQNIADVDLPYMERCWDDARGTVEDLPVWRAPYEDSGDYFGGNGGVYMSPLQITPESFSADGSELATVVPCGPIDNRDWPYGPNYEPSMPMCAVQFEIVGDGPETRWVWLSTTILDEDLKVNAAELTADRVLAVGGQERNLSTLAGAQPFFGSTNDANYFTASLRSARVLATANPTTVEFAGQSPRRFLDTRPGEVTYDSRDRGGGRLAAGKTYKLDVAGRSGVLSDASAVMMNVVAVQPSAGGFLTVWPCGETKPLAATLNYSAGQIIANALAVPIGSNGQICIYSNQQTNLVADISGFYPAGSDYSPLTPRRFLDTRPGEETVDGDDLGGGRLAAGKTYKLDVAGRSGVLSDASAVMMNVVAVQPSAGGFLTVWPCGETKPLAATLNYSAGQIIANALAVPIGSNGQICIYSNQQTNLVADISGYYPAN